MVNRAVLYDHLKSSSAQIRLIKLRRHDTNTIGQVSGELATFSLDDPQCPLFTTVSYTWGSAKEYGDEPVKLNGQDKVALKNVLALLRMLCCTSAENFDLAEDWFWIDSICINQDNLSERSSQVKLMGQIYRQAKATIVWLCGGSDDTNTAIELLSHLADRRHELRKDYKKRAKRMPEDLCGHPGWKSLERLLELPWWRRVWTLQEFLLAKELTFYCGAQSISRRVFRKALHSIELCGPLEDYIRKAAWTTAWNRRRLIQWYEQDHNRPKMSLVSLMAFCGDYETTDPRDRIWAMHGLAREEDRHMTGRPTYCYDERTLYTGLVQAFLYKYKSLDIMCFAQLFQSKEDGWPSWIPDWRVSCPPYVVPLMVSQSASDALANFRPVAGSRMGAKKFKRITAYRASGTEEYAVEPVDMFNHLSCRGIVIDSIDGLGGLPSRDERVIIQGTASTSPVNTTPADADHKEEVFDGLVRSLVLNRHDKYLESLAPVPRYRKEFRQLVKFADGGCEPGSLGPACLYKFVGECYVDGMMDGEALGLGREVQDFKIE
ncbi:hypothetical protein DHEL01_v208799 [Diaporthe helianthi]|uniref:Heterokaryon incompatibility domain-containing protein n=1 Tax=Diaporthe helianthi TaxID=158607 RepID=A0A2P5HRB2_DIAHE|nr:hypothetical protein DHEL01_v208799 [Diaporthe helianthi]